MEIHWNVDNPIALLRTVTEIDSDDAKDTCVDDIWASLTAMNCCKKQYECNRYSCKDPEILPPLRKKKDGNSNTKEGRRLFSLSWNTEFFTFTKKYCKRYFISSL